MRIARDLLTDDGVIFISIDDNEQENLKKICNEIFGSRNFVGEIIRKTKSMTGDSGSGFNLQHENLFVYSKNISDIQLHGESKSYENYSNPDNDPNGDWCSADPSAKSGGQSTYFEIENPYTHKKDFPPTGRYWAFSKETLARYIREGKIKFKQNYRDGERGFIFKRYKKDATSLFDPVHSLFAIENDYMNQVATVEVKKIFNNSVFSYPKPIIFIQKLLKYATSKNSVIMDFFSGSATTAHAVMQLNAEDGGKRKFIMVQLPELTDEKSEARKAGYKTICDIGEERIRRAGQKIKDESPMTTTELDTGFRVFRVDSSNMQNVYYAPADFKQEQLELLADNIKPDRTPEDLLFQVMLDLGITLSAEINETEIDGKKVFSVADGYMIACFDNDITEQTVTEIAKKQPFYAVFRDSGMASDSVMTNFEQIFETYSPKTVRRVL